MTGLTSEVVDYLNELFPNPRCELNYSKDYELVLAVMLSAQTTDKRVNMVTEVLFKKYPDLKALSEARLEDIIDIIRPIGTFNKKALNVLEIAKRGDCRVCVAYRWLHTFHKSFEWGVKHHHSKVD